MTRSDVIPALIEACPGMAARWRRRGRWVLEGRGRIYEELELFARHVVAAVSAGDAAELPAFFALLERMVTEGTSEVKKLATIGLIDDLQRIAMATGIPEMSQVLASRLGPESRRRWHAVQTMWDETGTLARLLRLRRPQGAGDQQQVH